MKKIILIVILLSVLGGAALFSYASILRIPIFSDIFYRNKIADLGVEISPEAVKSFSEKIGLTPAGILIGPILPEPRTIKVTDIEFTSWVNAMCQEFPQTFPLENFQIKFEKGKFKSSAHIFEPIEADVTVFGEISRKDEFSINIKFDKTYLGNVPAPKNISEKLEKKAEQDMNKILKAMAGLRIDSIELFNREGVFVGILPSLPLGPGQGGDDYHILQ